MWSVRDGKVEYVASMNRHSRAVNCVRFSPDGSLLASAGDGMLSLFNTINDTRAPIGGLIIIWRLKGEAGRTAIATEEADFDTETAEDKEHWQQVQIIRLQDREDIFDLTWSPCSKYVLVGTSENAAIIFDISNGILCLDSIIIRDNRQDDEDIQGPQALCPRGGLGSMGRMVCHPKCRSQCSLVEDGG